VAYGQTGSGKTKVRWSEGSERRELPNVVLYNELIPLLVASLIADYRGDHRPPCEEDVR